MENEKIETIKKKMNNGEIVIFLGERSKHIGLLEETLKRDLSRLMIECNPWSDFATPIERIEGVKRYLKEHKETFDENIAVEYYEYIVINDPYSFEAFDEYGKKYDIKLNIFFVEDELKIEDISDNLEKGYEMFLEPFELLENLNSIFN